MATWRIQKTIETAFVEEDKLPKVLHRTLDRIEAWLLKESKEDASHRNFHRQKNQKQKLLLLAHFIAKKTQSVCLITKESGKWNRHQIPSMSNSSELSLKSLPPYRQNHWYRMNRREAGVDHFFLYIDENNALFIGNSMPDSQRLAFFQQIQVKLKTL